MFTAINPGAENGLPEEELDLVPPNTERSVINLVSATSLHNRFLCGYQPAMKSRRMPKVKNSAFSKLQKLGE